MTHLDQANAVRDIILVECYMVKAMDARIERRMLSGDLFPFSTYDKRLAGMIAAKAMGVAALRTLADRQVAQ